MFIELHILQNFAPSCLNRDDTNSPKDCTFGGHRRARISSQCIKRSVRTHPSFMLEVEASFGHRSNQHHRHIAKLLAEDKQNPKPLDEAIQVGRYMFQKMGFKEKNERLTVMLLLGDDEIRLLADTVSKNWDILRPLANESLLWEQLAEQISRFLEDLGTDADMIGRLIANHRAGNATAAQLEKWLALSELDWSKALEAIRKMTPELRDELRAKFTVEEEVESIGQEVEDYVPQAAASLFKSKENKDAVDALKEIDFKKEPASRDQTSDAKKKESGKVLASIFKPLKKLKTKAVNIAMFGRMLAEIKSGDMNVNAACQVAHALSTNRVDMEMDFFTAVEDLKELAKEQGVEQDAGAGMLGTTEFNSACFYRYSNIDFSQLVKNLGDDIALARAAVKAFLTASVKAVPTGKVNSTAPQNPPSLVFAVVRKSSLWSLANAFEKPIYSKRDDGLIEGSCAALDQYWGKLGKAYGTSEIIAGALLQLDEAKMDSLTNYAVANLNDLEQRVLDHLPKGAS